MISKTQLPKTSAAVWGDILSFAKTGDVWNQAYQFSPFNLKPNTTQRFRF